MLTRLSQRLETELNPDAKPEEQKKVEALAKAKYVPISHVVRNAKGEAEAVVVDEPYDRAWRRLGLALDRAGFEIADRDRSSGIIEVKYLDPDYEARMKREQGWVKNLLSSTTPIDAVISQIRIIEDGADKSRITVLSKDGKLDATGVAPKIVSLIGEHTR